MKPFPALLLAVIFSVVTYIATMRLGEKNALWIPGGVVILFVVAKLAGVF